MHAQLHNHIAANAPDDLYEGSETGMSADTIVLTPLTVQQEIPNIADPVHAPQTQVIPELEQGEGRGPGWRMGWMRKNIPFTPGHIMSHMQRNYGPLRVEVPLGYESVRMLNRPSQTVIEHIGKTPPVNLEQPETVYGTAAASTLPTWGEPL